MGSVKDLKTIREPEENKTGIGEFFFSDRYSVFDWGEMPDNIVNKGKALCIMGAYFFEKLEDSGIKTHYLGIMENGIAKQLDELDSPREIMRVKTLRVFKPKIVDGAYDYSIYQKERDNILIPLEVIYRNSLPAGSSVFRRLNDGELKIEDIGLQKMPIPGQKLVNPILDVSTKLEATDRYINWKDAQNIVVMNDSEIDEIRDKIRVINKIISKETEKIRLTNEDGKFEFGFDEMRNIIVVDVLGTPDECRFTYDKIPVSKEIARIFYRDTSWYEEIKKAKKHDRVNWKNHVTISPPPLPSRLAELISLLYQACCNEITNKNWFVAPTLQEIINEIREELHQ
jgi:phosphoribosylaminoimidazole-succinocarboxamide synthase